ncbi:MAG: bifunctional (p)ppGpp synthetase/guanosine-3',5'-bis(diphosphate) 3'-pyrophosphohydrolase [Candidatus Woesearchaeota archaeon]
MKIEIILEEFRRHHVGGNIDLIKEAYETSARIHKEQKRASGQPYINHPLTVAYYLAQLGMDAETIAAGLLHDVVEESKYTKEDLKRQFGEEVAMLINGVTNISNMKRKAKEHGKVESIRKMLLATAKDIRVIFIKLCDRLHNMQTLQYLPQEKRRRIAKEALEIYAPLAYRLNLIKIKNELEDLSMKFLQPEIYNEIEERLILSRPHMMKKINEIKEIIESSLAENHIKAEVKGRAKSIYSIYRKMQAKDRPVEKIYDLIALRIITKTVKECYEVLGIIHNTWRPIPNELEDYIANPKPNGYQSLHTKVISDEGSPIEFQIRTKEMDENAEEGIAAHWKYKGEKGDKEFHKKMFWLKEIVEIEKNTKHPLEFIETLKKDLFQENIFCFTPKGDVIELPREATPVDFAYAIHSDIGDKCTGARVNDKFVSLRYPLKNGDVVEIITKKDHVPSSDWLKFTKTTKAIGKIRRALQLQRKLAPKLKATSEKTKSKYVELIEIENLKSLVIHYAQCCNPLPTKDTGAIATTKGVATIHETGCPNFKKNIKDRLKIKWLDYSSGNIGIEVIAHDRVGLLADIINTIGTTGTNIVSAKAKTIGKDARDEFIISIDSLEHLKNIIKRLMKVKGMKMIKLLE